MQRLRKLGSPALTAVPFSALLLICALLGGGAEEILGVLPAIFLVLALVCGRFPGEEAIYRLTRVRRKGPRAAGPQPALQSHFSGFSARIVFLAASRPLRGPPVLPSVSS